MKELSCFYSVVEVFRKYLSLHLPSQHISMVLLVAMKQGISQADLSRERNMPQGTVSRNIKLLSTYRERTSQESFSRGYGLLLTRPIPGCKKALGVHLTAKGRELVTQVASELRASLDNLELAS